MLMKSIRQLSSACLATSIAILPTAVMSQDLDLDNQLMEYLAGDPIVNRGSDDILTELPEENARMVTAGSRLYTAHCAACHGVNFEGQKNWQTPNAAGLLPAPPHDSTGHTWHHADDQLFEIVKYGPAAAVQDPKYRSMMPAFGSQLSDSEILSVLLYIRSTWPEEQRTWQAGVNASQTGQQWWREKNR